MALKVQTGKLLRTMALSLIFVMGWTLISWAASEESASTKKKNFQIQQLQWDKDNLTLRIQGDSSPVFTAYDLFNPARVIIDIADGSFPESLGLPLAFTAGPISKIKGDVLTGQVPEIAQLQLVLNEASDVDYKIAREKNDIVVQFSPTKKEKTATGPGKIVIQEITVEKLPLETRVHIKSSKEILGYTALTLDRDMAHLPRVCLDLPGVEPKKIDIQVKDSPLASVRSEMPADDGDGSRIVMESALEAIFLYSIEPRANGLDVIITKPEEDAPQPTAALAATGLLNEDNKAKKAVKPAPKPVIQPASAKKGKEETHAQAAETADFDNLSFTGYTAQKISVDFYKIDLHNVFRLIGDISRKNIVVAEGVSGSLTLALNEVPWDFALDIILNLKDLQKEERFNTIVISPKDKNFSWPENTATNLDIEVDKDPLKVQKRLEINKEALDAKKLIRQAREMEESGDYQGAATLYEKAIAFWPENSELAERTASLYLVHLGLNAKAAFFAQKAQKIDPDNTKAALIAAIALANMEKVQEAQEFFEIAVNVPSPTKQAMASYAAFCEQNNNNAAAIDLLNKFEDIYGSSLQVMISKARIMDKLGLKELADQEYRAILKSGEPLPKSLKKYIEKRLDD